MLNVKKLLTKVLSMFTEVVYYDKVVTASYAAGNAGTLGKQQYFANPAPKSYHIRSIFLVGASASTSFCPIAFYSGGNIYVNFYRANTSAVNNASVTVRIVYTKTAWGGLLT